MGVTDVEEEDIENIVQEEVAAGGIESIDKEDSVVEETADDDIDWLETIDEDFVAVCMVSSLMFVTT